MVEHLFSILEDLDVTLEKRQGGREEGEEGPSQECF